MFLSKRKSGIYHIFYKKSDGKITSVTTKTGNKIEAMKFLADFIQKSNMKPNRTIPIELKHFSFLFLKSCELQLTFKTVKGYQNTFNFLLKYFGNIPLIELDQKKIQTYLEYRNKTASIFQSRKDLIVLSSAFNWALREKYLFENPCIGIKRITLPEKQPLYYSEDEFQKLIEKIDNQDIRDLVVFAINTGLRQMELLTLQWEQINFNKCYVILDNRTHLTKTKKIRTVALNNPALEIISRRYIHSNSKYVFTYKSNPITQVFIVGKFKKYVKAAGINPKLNFHSLRHTFASWLIQKGTPIYIVSKLLGHSSIKTTEIYAHLRIDDLRQSVNLLNDMQNNRNEAVRSVQGKES